MAKRKEQSPCPYQYSYSRADYLEGIEPYK